MARSGRSHEDVDIYVLKCVVVSAEENFFEKVNNIGLLCQTFATEAYKNLIKLCYIMFFRAGEGDDSPPHPKKKEL